LNWPKKFKHQGLLLRYLLNNNFFEHPNLKLACQVFGLLGMLYHGSLTFCMWRNNWIQGFFCPVCRWTGHHPPEDLAKLRFKNFIDFNNFNINSLKLLDLILNIVQKF
jgi:hypothetical protein